MWEFKDGLVQTIKENVNVCQSKFGGRTVLATEREPSVLKVINCIELILQDGLKTKSGVNLKNVNHFSLRQVSELVSNSISMVMGPVTTQEPPDYGRGRSWLRSSINEHSLDRYLRMLFSDESLISSYYESTSLMYDTSCRECMINSSKELRGVIFALVVDRKELDRSDELKHFIANSIQPEPEAVLPKSSAELSKPSKKSKIRMVDLDSDKKKDEKVVNSFSSLAISIPESGHGTPSLNFQHNWNDNQSSDSLNNSFAEFKHSSLSEPEMRQMLLDLTERKNQLEEAKSSLQIQLHSVQTENQKMDDQLKTVELQNEELKRENSILREQLKQYMSAVQMLKTPEVTPTAAPTPSPDYLQEATYFEEKLIQVAEMHGELMEFNSHLQYRLQMAENLMNRLRNELVYLRGPLPSDYIRDQEATLTNNDGVNYSLVNVWIPSTFLVQAKADSYHVYQIYIRIGDTEWTIFKRYSEMHRFRKELQVKYPYTLVLNFPPKKNFGQRDPKVVEERRKKLQDFLRQFLNVWMKNETPINSTVTKTSFVQIHPFFGEPSTD